MEDDWDLEDWLLEAGEAAEKKHISGGQLSPLECLTRELWVFDMHSMNGGVAQYFANYAERWPELTAAISSFHIESLQLLVKRIDEAISGSSDPYSALLETSGLDDFYYENRLVAWRQVQAMANAA